MKKLKFAIGTTFIALLFLSFFTQVVVAQEINKNEKNVAIQGYDPVGYFTQGKAVKGSEKITVEHQGVIYQFASKVNARQFKKNPEKYTPQYGGFCAFGIVKGAKYPINPHTFKITDGKLYLFYNKDGTNTLTMWNKDETSSKKEADSKWERMD